jgi:hypothetical protein
MSQINKYAMCKHNNIVTDAPSIRLTFLSQKYILMIYRLLEFGSINCVCHVRKLKYKLSSNSVTDNFKFIIWILSYKICDVFAKKVNLIKICTVRHIRIKIIHGNQNVFSVLIWVGRNENIWLFPSISLLINSNKKKVSNMFVQDGHHYWELKFLQITIMCTEIEWD